MVYWGCIEDLGCGRSWATYLFLLFAIQIWGYGWSWKPLTASGLLCFTQAEAQEVANTGKLSRSWALHPPSVSTCSHTAICHEPTYYPPPKKKNKIYTEHRVCGLRVHHNCHKKNGIVEFFRTGSEPVLAPPTPYIYLYLYTPPKKKEKKNKSDADNCVSVLRLHHKYRKKFGIVEFFRKRPEPTLCEATTPLRYTLPAPEGAIRWGTAKLPWKLLSLGGRPTPFLEVCQQNRWFHLQLRTGHFEWMCFLVPAQQLPTPQLYWCVKCGGFGSCCPQGRSHLLWLQRCCVLKNACLLKDSENQSQSATLSPLTFALHAHPGSPHTGPPWASKTGLQHQYFQQLNVPIHFHNGEASDSWNHPRTSPRRRRWTGEHKILTHGFPALGWHWSQSWQASNKGYASCSRVGTPIPKQISHRCANTKKHRARTALLAQQHRHPKMVTNAENDVSSIERCLDFVHYFGRSKRPQLLCEGRRHSGQRELYWYCQGEANSQTKVIGNQHVAETHPAMAVCP